MEENKHEERLQTLLNNINEWLKFAEAKNFGLLTINAAIVIGISQMNFTNHDAISLAGNYVFIPFSVLSFFVALIPIMPIVSKIEKGIYAKSWVNSICNFIDKEQPFENIHFYGYLKGISEIEFEEKFLEKTNTTQSFTRFENELGTQILYNSRITWLKYQFFKIAGFILLAGLVFSIVSLLIFSFI